jgi:hypothetical protein
MRYIDSGMLLRQYLSNIHLLPVEFLPSCICVDDLSLLLSMQQHNNSFNDGVTVPYMNPLDVLHIKTWALLQNATQFLSEKLGKQVNFIVTDGLTSSTFYERWCPFVMRTQIYTDQPRTNPLNIPDLRPEQDSTQPVQVYMHVTKINGEIDSRKIRILYHIVPDEIILKKWDYTIE